MKYKFTGVLGKYPPVVGICLRNVAGSLLMLSKDYFKDPDMVEHMRLFYLAREGTVLEMKFTSSHKNQVEMVEEYKCVQSPYLIEDYEIISKGKRRR